MTWSTNCGHWFHPDCLTRVLAPCTWGNQEIPCPFPGCGVVISTVEEAHGHGYPEQFNGINEERKASDHRDRQVTRARHMEDLRTGALPDTMGFLDDPNGDTMYLPTDAHGHTLGAETGGDSDDDYEQATYRYQNQFRIAGALEVRRMAEFPAQQTEHTSVRTNQAGYREWYTPGNPREDGGGNRGGNRGRGNRGSGNRGRGNRGSSRGNRGRGNR